MKATIGEAHPQIPPPSHVCGPVPWGDSYETGNALSQHRPGMLIFPASLSVSQSGAAGSQRIAEREAKAS